MAALLGQPKPVLSNAVNEDAAMRDQHLRKTRLFDGDDMTGKVFAYALMALLTIGSVTTLTPAMAQEGGPPDVLPGGGGGDPAPEPEPEKKKEEPAPTPDPDKLTTIEQNDLEETNIQLEVSFIQNSVQGIKTQFIDVVAGGTGLEEPNIPSIFPTPEPTISSIYNEAINLHQSGNIDAAIEGYKKYLEQNPNDLTANYFLRMAQNGQTLPGGTASNYAANSRSAYPSVLMQDYVLGYAPARQNEAFNAIEESAARTPSPAVTAPTNLTEKKWNIWLSTSGSKANISGSDGSSAGVATGFNYLWNDRITLGLAGRFNASENKSASNTKSESKSWTLNPTASIKLTDKIVFGGSFAYGQNSTEITKNGVKNADYDSQTYLASGNLSTNWNFQDWAFSPFASMSYYAQRRDAYIDASNNSHSAKTSSLAQASIGSSVSRQFLVNETTALIPTLGLSSTYIFKKIDPDGDNFSARLDAGATLATTHGLTIALQGYYDGIGRSNYEVYGGSIRGALKF